MPAKTKQLINADIAAERRTAELNSEDFAIWWAGGREALKDRREFEQLFFNDPEFAETKAFGHMTHTEYYEHILKLNVKFNAKYQKYINEFLNKKNLGKKQFDIAALNDRNRFAGGSLGQAFFPQKNPLGLHYSMFLAGLLNNASEEQQREWVPKAWNMTDWIGTYAQTEIGHGTNIKALETSAEFDIRRQQFVLNTPTLSGYKWWPGSLGHTANIAIVGALLYINGKPCGLQQFLVPLRDEKTHEPLPGVDIGDIGPKIGFNGVNNGFLGLKNVRIPLQNMLMRHAQVLPSGDFVQSPDPTLLYNTMMFIRVGVVKEVSFGLLLAATIAGRYSVVRRQSPLNPGSPEPKILDHVTQQAKIIPMLAKGIIFKLTSESLWKAYLDLTQNIAHGNRDNMPQMHALSCVLKAVCSQDAEEGVEILRKSCGGHGYIASANFGTIYGSVTAACTYEGENTVLLLQTARFLVKIMKQQGTGKKLPETAAYLEKLGEQGLNINELSTDFQLMGRLVEILEHSTAALVQHAFEQQQKYAKEFGEEFSTNKAGVLWTKAATAHGYCYLTRVALTEAQKLHSKLSEPPQSAVLQQVLTQILELFIVDIFLQQLPNIFRFNSNITASQVTYVERRFEHLLSLLRPNVISIVDGFDYHDRVLSSTLGSWDGRAYERLMEEARKNPMNQKSVNPTFYTHLRPLAQGKL